MKWVDLKKRSASILEEYRSLTPYQILRVDGSASTEQIVVAYKRLAKIYHPDRSHAFLRKTNEEIMKLINQAYDQIMKERHGA
jgi:molecular chaperone DnaJ